MCLFVKKRCEVEMIGVSWERNKCMERVTLKELENGSRRMVDLEGTRD